MVGGLELLPVLLVLDPDTAPVLVLPLPWTTEKWTIVLVLHDAELVPHELFVLIDELSTSCGHLVLTIEVPVLNTCSIFLIIAILWPC